MLCLLSKKFENNLKNTKSSLSWALLLTMSMAMVMSETFGSMGALPQLDELQCFFSLMEPPSNYRRTSPVQSKYCQNIDAKFGGADLLIHVDRAIMACTRWWVQRYSLTNFQEGDVVIILNDLFAAVNYNKRNMDGSKPLISVTYLKEFMKLQSSENGRKSSMQQRYFKLFQKAVKDQFHDVYCLFKFSSPALVNQSLHQYSMSPCISFCPYSPCPYCKGDHPGVDSIFGFSRFDELVSLRSHVFI